MVKPVLAVQSISSGRGKVWLNSLPAHLRDVLSLADFERKAVRHLPRPLLQYVAGGVEDNVSRDTNRLAFNDWAMLPRVLVDVSARTLNTNLFGQAFEAPFGIAPMGLSALIAFDGDLVLARAAEKAVVPMIMSGASLTPMEAVAQAAPQSAWFQAYVPGDDEHIEGLIHRVAKAQYSTLVITVDSPTIANRENNVRAGFSTPLRPSARLAFDGLIRPSWLVGTLLRTFARNGMPHFENQGARRGVPIFSSDAIRQFGLKEHLSWRHLALIRRLWKGRLVMKGVLCPTDALLAMEHGVDGIIVSNHGGRQLDGAVSPIRVLPDIIATVKPRGEMAVMIDSGFRRGTDVIKALCLGADFVFVGRPMLCAAAVSGQRGVQHAIELLSDEVRRDMALLGVTSISELNAACLRRNL